MSDSHGEADAILRELQERAKELTCLYRIEELTSDTEAPLDAILEGVIAAIPQGWQFPDRCAARIQLDGRCWASPGLVESPWVQRAAIPVQGRPHGTLEVFYSCECPPSDEGPFLKEERRLIDTIAERLGSCLTHRKLLSEMKQWRQAHHELSDRSLREWQVILDLLRRTDESLLQRVTRKMINHLRFSGVREADTLLRELGESSGAASADALLDSNEPLPPPPPDEGLVEKTFGLAGTSLPDAEILQRIHEWVRQDRAAFLVNTVEDYRASLADIASALGRYLHTTRGEVELPTAVLRGLRVALVRRLLNTQLPYINVAKRFLDLQDFLDVLRRSIYPSQAGGKVGGKGSGLILADRILRRHAPEEPLLRDIRIPRTWYLTSDGLYDFIRTNHLDDVYTHKYREIEEIRREYRDLVQVFKRSSFSAEIMRGLSMALDELGDTPLIVRSSSLLEDRFGASFSGKYKSLFLANQGDKPQRLRALLDAVAEIYASTFGPDPIEYRAERNLLDFQEGMAILVQEVVGRRIGDYFLPTYAGVAFSHNEFRWSPRIRRKDGLVRLVPGLGTRAVDRLGDDYPVLAAPGQPDLRANATSDEIIRYSPRFLDLLNLGANRFETVRVDEFLRRHGEQVPGVEQLISLHEHGHLRSPLLGQARFAEDDCVVTFDGLLARTPFLQRIDALLKRLEQELGSPVDIEFACDGQDLYLLQCRAQNPGRTYMPAAIPRDVPPARVLFTANRYVSNGHLTGLTHLVYVEPEAYGRLERLDELIAVGRAVGRLNKLLPKRRFVLMGPGRWGSRGDIKLGVRVGYADINNTAALIEIARRKGDSTPDLSFGTHFFQDLVEASIRYLPLYPDEPENTFNERFLRQAPNILEQLAPEFKHLANVVRVIDVPRATDGLAVQLCMNADLDRAIAFLAPPAAESAPALAVEPETEPPHLRFWRWRHHMAELIAQRMDFERFGVEGVYLFGSTESASAGPGSDIDLLVHVRDPRKQQALLDWLEGWSLCLAEMNYLRTGYRCDGLLDVHLVTDDDIRQKTSYASKIDAITDPAKPLRLRCAPAAQTG